MPDTLWKWVIIGNSGVGKTSLLSRLCNDEFNNTFISTIGIDFKIKKMEVGGRNITVQIWDTAGQERFGTITKSCYRGSVGVILVYAVNDKSTYDDMNKWLNDIKLHTGEHVSKILVGNKCDIQSSRAVTREEGQFLADQNEIPFVETSAKTGKNVQEAFETLARVILGESSMGIMKASEGGGGGGNSAVDATGDAGISQSSISPTTATSRTSSYFSYFRSKDPSASANNGEQSNKRVTTRSFSLSSDSDSNRGRMEDDNPSFKLEPPSNDSGIDQTENSNGDEAGLRSGKKTRCC